VDVREVEEWDAGHVVGARHIPLSQLAHRLHELPWDRDLLFICRSGNRSGMAATVARCAGFDRVGNVSGGMLAWVEAGLPVEA
jgi:rhodanese-related sulfurtransferase